MLDLETARNIIESLNAIAVTDREGKYVFVNQHYTDFMGVDIRSLKDRYIWDVVPETKAGIVIQTQKAIIAEPIRFNGIDSFISYYPLFENGEFDGVLLVVIFTGIEAAMKFSRLAASLEDQLSDIKNSSYQTTYTMNNIIGRSPATMRLKEAITAASRTPSTVLIEGETGSGKELVAQSIHNLSQRSGNCFVAANCAAIPENLMESEFFGYESGAFTNARKGGKAGKFELANHGTIFLDEIQLLPYHLQPKLLRVLQERVVDRIGSTRSTPVDIRVIAASNIPLDQLVREDKFRMDLYYRLNIVRIHVPPLRDRKEDIPLIARNILYKLNYSLGLDIPDIHPKVYEMMYGYDWPGNIRELQNMIEVAMNRAFNTTLMPEHFEGLSYALMHGGASVTADDSRTLTKNTSLLKSNAFPSADHPRASMPDMKQAIQDNEYHLILNTLLKNRNNKKKTAEELGISRSTLYEKLKKYSSDSK